MQHHHGGSGTTTSGRRRRTRILVGAGIAAALAIGGLTGPALATTSGSTTPAPPTNPLAQVDRALQHLSANLALPHPGQPEALTHPGTDHASLTPAATATARPAAAGATPAATTSTVRGIDVSSHQGSVNWSAVAGAGDRFAYTKATEGTYYTNTSFAQQYNGSANAGLIRGSYHFAIPNNSGGAAQADYFVAHGGGWSADNHTLPGMLDIEYNPYGATCYGLTKAQMVGWITNFVNEYHADTGRWAVIYSTADWWSTCTGNSAAFGTRDPLWIAHYASSVGGLPSGWSTWTIWQYSDAGSLPGDQDLFNGSATRLLALANNNNGTAVKAPAAGSCPIPLKLGNQTVCL